MKDMTIDGGRGLVVDEGRIGDWSQTFTGKRFYPADPRPEDFDILDVAVSLANTVRYGGHVMVYSNAEHSVLVSHMVSPANALAGLLHDASEAYIGDMKRPVKRVLRDMGQLAGYLQLDERIQAMIYQMHGLAPETPQEVIEADTAICGLEREVLHPRAGPWALPPVPRNVRIACADPHEANRAFLARYCELTGQDWFALDRRLSLLEAECNDALRRHREQRNNFPSIYSYA